MNRSDSIVNLYFSETLCTMYVNVHAHIHTNSPFVPTQRNCIRFPKSNMSSHASGLLNILFPLWSNLKLPTVWVIRILSSKFYSGKAITGLTLKFTLLLCYWTYSAFKLMKTKRRIFLGKFPKFCASVDLCNDVITILTICFLSIFLITFQSLL